MFVLEDKFDECYAKIKNDALERDCSILIFTATDVDSICSTKVFLVSTPCFAVKSTSMVQILTPRFVLVAVEVGLLVIQARPCSGVR